MNQNLKRSIKAVVVSFLPVLLFAGIVDASEDKALNDGWAIQAGIGTLHGGGPGFSAEYQFKLNEQFRITPNLGLGISEGGRSGTTVYWLGSSLGYLTEIGLRHRLIFGPGYFGAWNFLNAGGVKRDFLSGISLVAGYKGTASFGLIWQATIGCVFIQHPYRSDSGFYPNADLSLGIGYIF